MTRMLAVCAVVAAVTAVAAGSGSQPPAGPAGDLYQAIRTNDLATAEDAGRCRATPPTCPAHSARRR